MTEPALLEAHRLTKYYYPASAIFRSPGKAYVRALEAIDLAIYPGEFLGVVGEAGTVKTTLARLLSNMLPPTSGRLFFDGQEVKKLDREGQQRLHREIQIVFQHPRTAFDPHFTIFQSLAEPLTTHTPLHGELLEQRIQQLLMQVGVRPEVAEQHPHDLNNAQLQRIAIARALALKPRFLILDDPLCELEPLAQVQVFNLLRGLRSRLQLTGLFNTRRMVFAQEFSDRIAVLHWGRLVELAPVAVVAQDQARHPYTLALKAAPAALHQITSVSTPELTWPLVAATNDPGAGATLPPPIPAGCSYHLHCPLAIDACARAQPAFSQVGDGHWVACHRANENILSR